MELMEMQVLWDQMNNQMEKKEILSEEAILEMTQQRYKQKFVHIYKWEGLGSLVCYGMATYILWNLPQLDTWYLFLLGIFSLFILFSLPTITLVSLTRLNNLDLGKRTYQETLIEYRKRKNRFLGAQRLGIYLSFGLVLTILPVMSKLLSGKDLLLDSQIEYGFIFYGILFVAILGRWGYTCYQQIGHSAEELLEELDG